MKQFEVTAGYVSLQSGTIKLSQKQFGVRAHALKETGAKGVYDIVGETQFKLGEVFYYDGTISPALALELSEIAKKPAKEKPAKEKPAKEKPAKEKPVDNTAPANESADA